MLDVKLHNPNVEIFLNDSEIAEAQRTLQKISNPIILHPTSKCSINQNWEHSKWEALIKSMPNFNFIQIGLEKEKKISGTINLCGKQTLRQAIALIKCAPLFVGVDSVFAHATNAFRTNGVVLFGDSSPKHWGHDNNINIYKNLRCSPCIDRLYGQDCCPYNKKCMNSITVEEVRNALLTQYSKAQNKAQDVEYA